jgi:hypothetical protein
MATFSASLIPVDQREQEFLPILVGAVDPLLQIFTLSATFLSNPGDMAAYMINCLNLAKVIFFLSCFIFSHHMMMTHFNQTNKQGNFTSL